jgi:hypothetical protein
VSRWRTPAILGLLLVLGVGATLLLYERVEEDVERPPSREARENRTLAMQRMLQGRGVQVTAVPALTIEHLAESDTILWLAEDRLELVSRNRAVADWVGDGGRLLLGLGDWDHTDPMIGALVAARGALPEDGLESSGRAIGPYTHDDEGDPVDVSVLPQVTDPVLFECSAGEILGIVGGLGAGRIALLADLPRYRNTRVAGTQGAALFWDVARHLGLGERVLLVYDESTVGLATLLWRHARPAVVSFLVLLAVWLWHASRRFGPPIPERERVQRSLLEHVAATGSLLWRQGARDVLLDSVRGAVRHRVAVSRADWAFLGDEELSIHLAALTDLSPGDVLAALTGDAPSTPGAFARQITHLQTMRAALGGSA